MCSHLSPDRSPSTAVGWPDEIFPIVNLVFSDYDHFGLGGSGGGGSSYGCRQS